MNQIENHTTGGLTQILGAVLLVTLSEVLAAQEISADHPAVGVLYEPTTANHILTRCGVALVRADWGITAAHCVKDKATGMDKKELRAFFFDYGLIDVIDAIPHPLFVEGKDPPNPIPPQNDIALIQFKSAIRTIEPISVMPVATDQVQSISLVSGWRDGPSSTNSRNDKKTVDPITLQPCTKTDKTGILCWVGGVTQRTAEPGDSGGPIVAIADDNKAHLLGVLSFGSGGSNGGVVGDESWATEVEAHQGWIAGKLRTAQNARTRSLVEFEIQQLIGSTFSLSLPDSAPSVKSVVVTVRSPDTLDPLCQLDIAIGDHSSSCTAAESARTVVHCTLRSVPRFLRIKDPEGACHLARAQWRVVGFE